MACRIREPLYLVPCLALLSAAACTGARVEQNSTSSEASLRTPSVEASDIGPDRFKKVIPCIPRITIGPTGQIIRQGCGSTGPAPCGDQLRAEVLTFRIRDVSFGSDGSVTGSVESVVSGCDGNGQIEIAQLSLGANRWQYKPSRANKTGIYNQTPASVPAQPQATTYTHAAGTPTVIPFRF